MKKLALLTIPLLAVFAMSSLTAHAAAGEAVYPNSDEDFIRPFPLTSLSDYAIEDGIYAFADGKSIKVLNSGSYEKYDFNSEFSDVDIKNGVIYCLSNDLAYFLKVGTDEQYSFEACNYTFNQKADRILYGDCLYFTNEKGLNIFDMTNPENVTTYDDGRYSNLKQYGENIFAMSENSLYTFTGTEKEKVTLEYEVKPDNIKIEIGNTSTALKRYSSVQFVEIAEGAIMTEIEVDLEKLGDDYNYFKALDIVKTEEATTALLLCESSNLSIVSIRDKAYAVLQPYDKTTKIKMEYTTEKTFESAQITGGNIYASPFVAKGTIAFSNAAGITVKVLNRIENEILECVFFEIEYTIGQETITGYVA